MRKGLFLFTVLLFFTHQLFAQCDTVSNLMPSDTFPVGYPNVGGGYITGQSTLGDIAVAEQFNAPQPDTITDIIIYFDLALGWSGNQTSFHIWDDSGPGASPGNVIGTDSINVNLLTPGFNRIHLSTPVEVSGTYYVGMGISYGAFDSLAISATDGVSNPTNTAWRQLSGGSWETFADPQGLNLPIGLWVFPVLCPGNFSFPVSATVLSNNFLLCVGDTTTLQAFVQDGSGSFSYIWSPGSGLSDSTIFNPLLTQTDSIFQYQLRVIDLILGDTAYSNVLNFNPLAIELDTTQAGCVLGGNQGRLTVNVIAGSAPLVYNWSNGVTTPSIYSTGGTYSVTVTDGKGCTQVATGSIFPGLNVSLGSTPDTCNTGVGSLSINSIGQGFGQVGWEWSTGSRDSIVTGLDAGAYIISIRDTASGCNYQQLVSVANTCTGAYGRIFEDKNQNGTYDAGVDEPLAGAIVTTSGGNTSVSDISGNYALTLDSLGTQTIKVLPLYSVFCSGPGFYLPTNPVNGEITLQVTSLSQVITGQDFAMSAPPAVPCGSISGHVFTDLDSNGVQSSNEPNQPGMRVQIGNDIVITNAIGDYSLSVPLNQNYEISLLPVNNQTYYCGFNVSTNHFEQIYPANSQGYFVSPTIANPNVTGNDFHTSDYLIPNYYDAGIYNISPYSINEPGETFTVYMDFKRIGEFTSDCTIRVEFDSTYLTLQGASLPIHASGPGFVEFYFPANSTISSLCMGMVFSLSPNVPAGHVFTWTAYFTCDVADYCSANDTLTRSVTYTGVPKKPMDDDLGYTFMRSFPNTQLTDGYIDRNDTIFNYLIQIQNTTGDTVRHLIVTDTLPSHLRVESVSLPFSPKSFDFQIDENGAMLIEFENIVLPDSSQNFDKSCLFIQYNVVLKGGLPGGTVIRNRAAAYFNYSDVPVFTNYAVNKIAWLDGVEPLNTFEFHVYPNPNNGTFMLQLDKAYDNATLTITNLAGMTVLNIDISGEDKQAINLHEQGSGVYFVEVVSNGLRQVKKIVVTH